MGMEGKLRQASEFELAGYCRNPAKLYSDLMKRYDLPDLRNLNLGLQEFQKSPLGQRVRQRALSGQPPIEEDVAESRRQIQAIMSQHPEAAASVEQAIGLNKDGKELSLHKSWHCLHFILTGKSWDAAEPPLGNAILGGVEIPDVHKVMGYDPARFLTPQQVTEVAAALESFPIEERAEAFDPETAEKEKVYVPGHHKEELVHYFGLLRAFYRDAANKGNGMLLWVE